jgi:hypothetical protein
VVGQEEWAIVWFEGVVIEQESRMAGRDLNDTSRREGMDGVL